MGDSSVHNRAGLHSEDHRSISSSALPKKSDGTVQAIEPDAQKRRYRKPQLLKYHEVPHWLQDNHYILTHYRPLSSSYLLSLHSLTYLHNESVNIYTHLLGALLSPVLGYLTTKHFISTLPSISPSDILVLSIFFTGAFTCLLLSTTFHSLSNHSHAVCKFGNALDYLGIISLITGSFVPMVYYGFYCHPRLQLTYWAMMCTIGAGCAVVSLKREFRTPAWRPFRAGMFVGMGLSSVAAVVHGLWLFGVVELERRMQTSWMVTEGFLYILGAGLYAARIPERFAPGKFDVWASSHQVFHVLVLCAASAHLRGLVGSMTYAHQIVVCTA